MQDFPQYLDDTGIRVYIEDAVALILTARPQKPVQVLNEYLKSVLAYEQVLGREFAYVHATQRNRKAFAMALEEGTSGATEGDVELLPRDIAQLALFICPDFPPKLLEEVAGLLQKGNPRQSTQGPARGGEVLRAFYVYFYYQEFFTSLAELLSADGGIIQADCVSVPQLVQWVRCREAEDRCAGRIIPAGLVQQALRDADVTGAPALGEVVHALLTSHAISAGVLRKDSPNDSSRKLEEACAALSSRYSRQSTPAAAGAEEAPDAAADPLLRGRRKSKKAPKASG